MTTRKPRKHPAAKQLRATATYDDALALARENYGDIIIYGEPTSNAKVPASDASTDRAIVAKDVASAITTFWVPPSDAYVVLLTTAIIATWNQDAFDIATYLRIKGDSVGSKGIVERIIQNLAYPGRLPDGTLGNLARRYVIPTSAMMFRTIERYGQPTMILSEAGKWLNETPSKFDKYEDVKALVQEGFERGAIVPRFVNGEIKDFDVFCPKVLSGTGTLEREIENRCIPILTQEVPKARHRVRKFRQREASALLLPVRESIAAISTPEYVDELRERELALYDEPGTPRIPDIGNRADDACTPLIAIADSISDEWGENVRRAIVEIMGTDDDTPDVPLDRKFLEWLMHAMRQKYVAATSRHDGRQSPPLGRREIFGNLTNADFGWPLPRNGRQPFKDFSLEVAPDKQEAHLYVEHHSKRDSWRELHSYVSRASNGKIADVDTVLAALDKAGRLTREAGRNLTVKRHVWKGSPQVRCLRIDVSDLFTWDERE